MSHSPNGGDPHPLQERIAGLPGLDRHELEHRWTQIYRREPPARTSRQLMVRAIAYHMQVEAHGGLDRRTRRRLEQIIAGLRSGEGIQTASPRIKPGTRLVREWNGAVCEVLVLEEGFAFGGKVHRSLSGVARAITGTNWNGHVFFGLKRRAAPSGSKVGRGAQNIRAPEQADG